MSDENLFAPPAAPVEDAIERSGEGAGRVSQEVMYREAVGPFSARYIRKFNKFTNNESSRRSWNFGAMIFGFFWFVYRRMYVAAFLVCVVGPAVLLYVPKAVMISFGLSSPVLLAIPTLLYAWVLVPLYADFLYFGSVEARIGKLKEKYSDDAEVLRALRASKGINPVAAVVILLLLLGAGYAVPRLFVAGNANTEAQVKYAYDVTALVRTGVVKYYNATHQWPDSMQDLEREARPLDGSIALTLTHGTISVHFDARFGPRLAGHVLSFAPSVNKISQINWSCGYATPKESVGEPAGPNQTDVDVKALPRDCRI